VRLPAKCAHRRSAKNWLPDFWRDPKSPPCCRTNCDIRPFLPKPGPLCESMKHTVEEYRFVWRSSFDGEAMVQIGRGGKNIIIDWARSDFSHGNGRYWHCIKRPAWEKLETALLAASFWSLDAVDDRHGLDGAQWLIEGRRKDVYRAVRRWSPEGAVYDLGRTFLDIAGLPIADIELY
jgi:hypothetical protein